MSAGADAAEESWAQRAADRSPIVQRSRSRSIEQAKLIVAAGRRLVAEKGTAFTIQELAKEAGVALQTFYRHFAGKDELLLAALEEQIAESCVVYGEQARTLPDPITRLHFYITAALTSLLDPSTDSRFVTAEHFRLHQLFPDELAVANRPFTDLIIPEIEAATAAGLLAPTDVERDAWFVTQLVMATYHYYAFASRAFDKEMIEGLWRFCLAALGGGPGRPVAPAPKKKATRKSS